MAMVAAALVAFFAFVTTRLSTPSMSLLLGELAVDDSSQIVNRLDGMSVQYELRGDRTQIFVPANEVLRLRMMLAGEGLLRGGSVGYEIFDQESALGTTQRGQEIKRLRALEGELARTITSLAPVRAAGVHRVLPTREPFSRDRDEPSASIMVQLRVRHSCPARSRRSRRSWPPRCKVCRLQTARVSVVDSSGTLLSTASSGAAVAANARTAENMRVQFEDRLAPRGKPPASSCRRFSCSHDHVQITAHEAAPSATPGVARCCGVVQPCGASPC